MRYLFTGDSITDCGRSADPLGLGSGYVDLVATALRVSDRAAEVLNTGVAGNRVGQLLARLDDDVLAHHPDVCTVLIGVNDTLVAFYQGAVTPDDEFDRDLDELLGTVARAAPRVIVIEPFFVDPGSATDYPAGVHWAEGAGFIRDHLAGRRATIRDAAARHGCVFVPLQLPFERLAELRGAATVLSDGVHPTPLGHRLVADAWLEALRVH